MPKAVVLLSGGLDSTTCLAQALADGCEVTAISFRYGQRHTKELTSSQNVCDYYNVDHVVIDLDLSSFRSALTRKDIDVPMDREGELDAKIPITYVPARNIVFLSIAAGLCESVDADRITSVSAGEYVSVADYTAGGVWLWPREFSIDNYRVVVNDGRIWQGFLITILRTVIGTVSSLLFVSLVAYAMSRKELKFRRFFHYINIFTMFFGGGLIPTFLVIKMLGLLNSFWVYIIPGIYSVYNMIIMRAFFAGIPNDLREAAYLDGAGEYSIFFRIYLPSSMNRQRRRREMALCRPLLWRTSRRKRFRTRQL